jgi:hypothetical protein
MAPFQGIIQSDQPPLVEGEEGLVHGLHPELRLADLHLGVNLVDLILADKVAYGGIRDHDFNRQASSWFPGLRKELLSEHPLQDKGELGPDLGLLMRWEDIDDPIDGLYTGIRMQGCKGEMAGFSDDQCGFDGLQVPHLANEDDIRILPQDVF